MQIFCDRRTLPGVTQIRLGGSNSQTLNIKDPACHPRERYYQHHISEVLSVIDKFLKKVRPNEVLVGVHSNSILEREKYVHLCLVSDVDADLRC